jgi:hypothetical protein
MSRSLAVRGEEPGPLSEVAGRMGMGSALGTQPISRSRFGRVAVLVAGTLFVAGCGESSTGPHAPVLDQQNLLDGTLGGQGIGRFSDFDGSPDPTGTSYDLQDAQTFTAGISGRLTSIRVAVRNLSGASLAVILEIRNVVAGAPDPDDAQVIGSASVEGAGIVSSVTTDPSTWPSFDVQSLGVDVVAGNVYSFSVRSLSTLPYLYNPELTSGYDQGAGYRRNRALGTGWSSGGADFGFQTFVSVP